MKWIKYLLDSILQQPPFWKIVCNTPLILCRICYSVTFLTDDRKTNSEKKCGKQILKKKFWQKFLEQTNSEKGFCQGYWRCPGHCNAGMHLLGARVQSQSRCWDLGVPLNLYCWMNFQHFWICMRYLQIKIPASTQFAKSVVECVIITSCGRREADEGGSSSHLLPPISCF